MNGVVKEREWLGSPLVGGYVKTKTLEKVLSIAFALTYHISRQFQFMVFPPAVFIRICGAFAYIPAMFLPWRYTWVVPILVLFTAKEPVVAFLALTAGIQVSYFTSRILKRYRVLSLLLATLTANIVAWYSWVLIGLIPPGALSFCLLKAAVTAVAIAVLAPPILKILESKNIIEFKR